MNNATDPSFDPFRDLILSYCQLTEQEWSLISEKLSVRFVSKGHSLMSRGEICDSIWFISKGLVRYYQYDNDLQERTTCFARDNEFATPFFSYLKGAPSREVLLAAEDCEIIEIRKADFLCFVETLPAINSMYRQVLEEAYLQMEDLNYVLQNFDARERYERLILQDAPELLQRVPLVHIASYLGISPETLSRVRAKVVL